MTPQLSTSKNLGILHNRPKPRNGTTFRKVFHETRWVYRSWSEQNETCLPYSGKLPEIQVLVSNSYKSYKLF